MKNRRTIIVAFVLLCCMCLGIGYASLTDTLNVDGSVSISPNAGKFDEGVYFSAAEISYADDIDNGNIGVTIGDNVSNDSTLDDKDKLTITIPSGVLTHEDDYTVIKATIANESDYAVSIALKAIYEHDNYKVDCFWDSEFNTAATSSNGTINEPSSEEPTTIDVYIKITETAAPTEDVKDEDLSLTFTATPVTNTNN